MPLILLSIERSEKGKEKRVPPWCDYCNSRNVFAAKNQIDLRSRILPDILNIAGKNL
jgi:hypothetical protein